ncbi:MAG: PD-(D/E)XK nuclease family protein, partial [Ruminococcus sp.]|nr:PD-(D/E)XK nuclease family protein [Ruminococcus sp.]
AILIDILRIIANPLQDIPMASVMVSPMYTFSVEELAYIKSFGNKESLYPLLIKIVSGEVPDFDVKLAERCDEFIKSIESFRLNSITMTIGELINSIYDTTDFISVMQLYSDGDKKRANLRLLIQYARNYETFAASDGSGGISGFLRHIDRILENDDYNQSNVPSSTGDYVKVQTLHKSKGLEYPFVFMCELSSGFKKQIDSVICSDNGEMGFTLYDKNFVRKYKTFQHVMLTEDNKHDSRSEEMRLLYVGLTRARQQLFINLNCNEKSVKRVKKIIENCIVDNGSIREAVLEANSFSDWLWICLMMHNEFPSIAELVGIDNITFNYRIPNRTEKLFDYELVTNMDEMLTENSNEFVPAKADDSIVENLRSIINSNYDRTLSEMTAKLSVTQITKKINENEPFDFHLKRPEFLLSGSKLTGAERGTAIHTFFQYCNFKNASENATAEIKNLVNTGFLTMEQAECIKSEKVKAFFESELYKKIKSAVSYERERKFMVSASQLDFSNPILEKLKNSDNMIKGIIDIMYEESDGIVIVDYKSDRGLSAEKLAERYKNQLMLYKSAVELITEKKVKGLSLYSIELEKEII